MKLFLILLMFVYSVDAEQKFIFPFLTPLTDRVVTEINALKPTWKAGKNFHGTAIPISKLVATRPEVTLSTFREIIYPNTTLPESFDAREAWPNCPSIGKIYDQKKGFPSWIYPTVGSIADRLCIKAGIQIDVEATVERIMKSNGDYNSAYNSANIRDNIYYWSKKGIFTVSKVKDEICLPFAPKGCKPNVIKLDKYFKVIAAQPKNAKDIMSDLMLNGPIPANMRVYTDFPSYQSGVYMPTSYWSQGLNSMKLIGWGTENGTDYWLATNSWGTEWGEKGYCKIKRETRLYGTILYGISPSLVRTDVISEIRKNPVDDQLFQLA